ncbi:hypothetical protein [Actinoplanes solisilvae]|uniref:hypothetical protein n=1 Tax=Actinoplanes solisilvae TaxID=2486853 RepID=UPI000FD955D7|nr:hypothetical protein [Actinoplanes solisilvae]
MDPVNTDPTTAIAQLPDTHPFLLLPVRLETRFGTAEDGRRQLWVRVFPDDVLVDTFDPTIAAVELANLRLFWTAWWRARGTDAGRRAAWRSLATSHGSGRARWLIDQYAPVNPDAEPTTADGDHVLVITPPAPVAAADQPAIAAYFTAVWQATTEQAGTARTALDTALGATRAAEVVATLQPVNIADPAVARAEGMVVHVAFLDLPPDPPTTDLVWTQAARAWLLPERFVLLASGPGGTTGPILGEPIPAELQVGPDPSQGADGLALDENGDLTIPDAMAWTVDFDAAVAAGMGFRLDLDDGQARNGFDRIVVLGVRLADDPERGATGLETLIRHHQSSRKALALVPQGTPTNNTDDQSSGYTWWDDPDRAYDDYFVRDTADDPADWRLRTDGRWLAGLLGVDRTILHRSPGYFGTDLATARAMNTALWPATLGYFLDRMMAPLVPAETVRSVRELFIRFVLGGGVAPAIRVGPQPYGILPATAWSRAQWFLDLGGGGPDRAAADGPVDLLPGLFRLIEAAVPTWRRLAAGVAHVGPDTPDPQQTLLDIVGLHPASAEFHQRYAETFDEIVNLLAFVPGSPQADAARTVRGYVQDGLRVLASLGIETPAEGRYPQILDRLFLDTPSLLRGGLVEPLTGLRADGLNYLQWLASAARTSHDALRRQAGFTDDVPPAALLYLLTRHALDLGYVDTGFDLLDLSTADRVEPRFLHVADAETDTPSSWRHLYRPAEAVTGDSGLLLGEFIPRMLDELRPYLNEQIAAVERLATVAPAGLERALVDHLDTCSYRLDAWRGGLTALQLAFMRGDDGVRDDSRRGVLIGAYGWLEDVRPRGGTEPVELPPELATVFQRTGDAKLTRAPGNEGHLHAPSLDHAVTAAILRAGHLANASAAQPEILDIDLTSARVRVALSVIDGVRSGQSLGALLGYRLERALHDHDGLFLDRLIDRLRRLFPLAGNRQASTATDDPAVPVTAVEARNVVDGLALVEHLDTDGANPGYPYGLAGLPTLDELAGGTGSTPAEVGAVVDASMHELQDVNDAVADLAMAEAVYQTVRGNHDRAAGTLDAYAKGAFPPTPEVATTPRSGSALTHRIAVHLPGQTTPPAGAGPRALGEPALDAWAASLLPPMSELTAVVVHTDPDSGLEVTREFSMADLGLRAVDLVYLAGAGTDGTLPGLDGLLLHHARRDDPALRDDIAPRAAYPPDGSLFAAIPLVASVRGLMLGARPLRPTDLELSGAAGRAMDAGVVVRADKAEAVLAALTTGATALGTLATELETAVGAGVDDTVALTAALAGIDGWVTAYGAAVDGVCRFGLPSIDPGRAADRVRPPMAALLDAIATLAVSWRGKRDAFAAVMDDFDALPPAASDDERYALLVRAARTVSTTVIAPLPPVADLVIAVRDLDDDLRAAIEELAGRPTAEPHLGGLHAAVAAFAPGVPAFDPQPWDLTTHQGAVLSAARDLLLAVTAAVADIDARLATARGLLDQLPGTQPARAPGLVQDAARAVLGESFLLLPEFALTAERLAEWDSAWTGRDALLDHLRDGPDGSPFPVDDWLHGLARVREKAHHAERVQLLGDLELSPLQFPHRAAEGWLADRLPPEVGPGEHLLYTVHTGPGGEIDASDPGRTYSGILVDEWVETVPGTSETTGLAFHYDRPSSEPPQVLLLVTPPRFTGAWQWDDLVDTLTETLDAARMRLVEPDQVAGTGLAKFLPAVLSSVTVFPITAALNLSYNNAVQAVLVREDG